MGAVSFGATASAYGLAQSTSQETTAEISQCRGVTGKVTDEKAYSVTTKGTTRVVLTEALPAGGAGAIAIAGVTGLVERISVTEENTGYKQAEITVTKSDASTQVAYS
jgi:hypothetical protein